MRATERLLLAVIWLMAACGDGTTPTGGPPGFESRPYALDVAPGHDPSTPTALLLVLHGYGSSGSRMEQWWQLSELARARDVLVAHPDGNLDSAGKHFWNATDVCCDYYRSGVDDVGYLRAVIADVSARYAVDPTRIYVTGHSNGGYMAHRMACDAADVVAAIAPVSGVIWKDPSQCQPSTPVPVLQVMGTQDAIWAGWANVTSEAENIASWAAIDGCAGELVDTGERLDLANDTAGAETRVSRHACPQGAAIEEWAMVGVGHVFSPRLPDFGERMLDWLEAHRRQ